MDRLYIFDFDDTLVSTGSLIRIKNNEGIDVRCLSSAEFADPDCDKKITEEEISLGYYEDFSDFEKYPYDATLLNPIFDIFLSLVNKGKNVIVLTARAKSYPVKKFLTDRGAKKINVYAVGGSDPQLKVKVVDFLVKKGEISGVSLFEDSVKNINAITDYMSSISNIDFKSVTVPHIRWLSNKKVDRNSKKYDNSKNTETMGV